MTTRGVLGPFGPMYAFTAGYVDTVGYFGLFGLFTAHVTGNLVLIGASIAHPDSGLITKLSALPVFVIVVALTSVCIRRRGSKNRTSARGLLAAQAILLLAFMALALAASPLSSGDQPLAVLAGLGGMAAMAIQNGASRTIFADLAPTTVMTGNVTQLVLDLTDLMRRDIDRAVVQARLVKTAHPLLAFALGAVIGGLAFSILSFSCLAAPIMVIVVLAAMEPMRPAIELETGVSR